MIGWSWHSILLAGITGLAVCGEEPAIVEVVRKGNLAQLNHLIARKHALHARGTQGQTALHEAAATCNVQAAWALVQAGLDRSLVDNAGATAAAMALRCQDPAVTNELLRILYVPRPHSVGPARDAPPWTLQGAAARGDASVAEMLLKLHADVNGVNEKGDRALEVACRKGDARMAEILLKAGADVKLISSAGTSALHEAALGGERRVVELLIQHGAIVDVADHEKAATPLHYAASFGRLEAARVLVQHGADVRRKDGSGRDALTLAVENGHSELKEMLRAAAGRSASDVR